MTTNISESTSISLKLGIPLLAIAAAFGGLYWRANSILSQKQEQQFAIVQASLNEINSRLAVYDATAKDGYSKSQAAEAALRNAILNPGLKFSDPRNPGQFIVVEGDRPQRGTAP